MTAAINTHIDSPAIAEGPLQGKKQSVKIVAVTRSRDDNRKYWSQKGRVAKDQNPEMEKHIRKF